MSFKNFVPIALSEKINQELSRDMVFYDNVNHEYEGKAREIGDVVKILNAGKPSIAEYSDGKLHALSNTETLQGSSIFLPLDHVAQYNFKVDDLDKAQAAGNLYSVYMSEAKEGIADVMDKYIASFAADKNAKKLNSTVPQVTKDNVLGLIDQCLEGLYANDVKPSTEITLTASPKFFTILKDAYRNLDTNNHELLAKGIMGTYNGITLKMSNNVATASGAELIQVKTNRAIAFAKPYVHVEPYRIENEFSDAVKGYALYGGVLARPKEMVVLNVKY